MFRCKTIMRIRYRRIYLIYLDRRNRLVTGALLASVARPVVTRIILESVPCVTDARGIRVRFTCCPVTIRRWVTVIPLSSCIKRSRLFVQPEPVTVRPLSVYNVLTSFIFTLWSSFVLSTWGQVSWYHGNWWIVMVFPCPVYIYTVFQKNMWPLFRW